MINLTNMRISAGIAIVFNKKILLAHSKNSSWWKSWMPPKGTVEHDEIFLETAIRELKEEVGIDISFSKLQEASWKNRSSIKENKNLIEIPYFDKKGAIHKLVFIYIYEISDLSEINLTSEIIPVEQLQLSEIDDARFFNLEEYEKRVHPLYLDKLKHVFDEI